MTNTISFSIITGLFILSGMLGMATPDVGTSNAAAAGPAVAISPTPLGTPVPSPEPKGK